MERLNVLLSFANRYLKNRLPRSFPAFRWDVKLEALTFTLWSSKKSALFFLGREAVALTPWPDSQHVPGGPFKTGPWMLQHEKGFVVSAMCMWVFNECELIKLATLNYNLIPSAVPLRLLA